MARDRLETGSPDSGGASVASTGPALVDPMRIASAVDHIDPVFLNTPLMRHADLDRALGAQVMAKVETINPIRCFKGRGTDQYFRSLSADARHVVAASAGNFGQALAYCSRSRDLAVTIFAAERANRTKLAAIAGLGAEVRVVDGDFEDAKAAARSYAERTGARFAEDSAAASFAEGAGTIGLELANQVDDLDVVLIPLGNGALAAGIGAWMRYACPSTEVIGVVADAAPAMKLSLEQREVVETQTADTVADGIATRIPVPFGLASCLQTLTDVVSVSDPASLAGAQVIQDRLGLIAEPSAGVGAAALATQPRFAGARAAIIICGSNVARPTWPA